MRAYQLAQSTGIDALVKADLASPKDAFALLGEAESTAKWGVPPRMIGDVLALSGDSVDNIPGVAGLGRKTASALITEFGGLDNLLRRTDIDQHEARGSELR